jgi:hypothetical protein
VANFLFGEHRSTFAVEAYRPLGQLCGLQKRRKGCRPVLPLARNGTAAIRKTYETRGGGAATAVPGIIDDPAA